MRKAHALLLAPLGAPFAALRALALCGALLAAAPLAGDAQTPQPVAPAPPPGSPADGAPGSPTQPPPGAIAPAAVPALPAPPSARPGPGASLPAPAAAPVARPGSPAPPRQVAAPAPKAKPSAATGAAATAEIEPGRAGGDAHVEGGCVPLQGKFLLAFNKADIVDVLEQASRWTCRNFAFTEDVARGKITLLSRTPVTAEEAYAAFLAALSANNIAVYPSGRYNKLVRLADAKKTPIPTLLSDGTEVPSLEQPVTKLFRLRSGDADQLRGVLSNFISPQGADLQSLPPDVLILTDIGLNVRRIEKMLEALDRPGSGELIRFIQVKYAAARDLAEKVNQVFQQAPAGGRGGRRTSIGGVAPGQPAAPGAPAPAPVPAQPGAGAGDDGPLSISKVMADERTNKLVVIADEKSFQRIRDLVEQLDVPTAGEGQVHVLYMKNASAEDLSQSLQALAQGQSGVKRTPGAPPATNVAGFQTTPPAPATPAAAGAVATSASLFSGEVKITADKVANALIVLASGSDFATVQRLVDRLDRPRRQVFVEAAIIEVNVSDENQFGVSAHGAIPIKTSDGTGFIPLASETGRLNSLSPLSSLSSLGGLLGGVVGPTSTTLTDIGVSIPSVSVLVQALQTNSDVNVISTPHVLATDNEDAEITVGQNVPFQAGFSALSSLASSTTTSSAVGAALGSSGLSSLYAPIQRQNVELRLRIKPMITEGDNIRLNIDEQTEEIASKDPQLGPTTAKRTIKTNISVKDQSTIVIGGLIQDRSIQSVRKTPLLGDIPVLGWLFRDQVTTKTKTNLLLFLTPYIIHDPGDYRRIYERKRAEQQSFMQQFYGTQSKYEPVVDYDRKPSPYTHVRKDVELETQRLENGGPGAPGEGMVGPRGRFSRPRGEVQERAPGELPPWAIDPSTPPAGKGVPGAPPAGPGATPPTGTDKEETP